MNSASELNSVAREVKLIKTTNEGPIPALNTVTDGLGDFNLSPGLSGAV